MKSYERAEVHLHVFLTSAPDRRERRKEMYDQKHSEYLYAQSYESSNINEKLTTSIPPSLVMRNLQLLYHLL
jgi:hypothetical protein